MERESPESEFLHVVEFGGLGEPEVVPAAADEQDLAAR